MATIYQIRSKSTEKIYIGSAVKYARRKAYHLWSLRHNKGNNGKLQNHFTKYGESDFVFEIIEDMINDDIILNREQFYIDSLKPFFNIAPVAGNCLGCKHNEESKLRRKGLKNRLGIKNSPETREKLRIANLIFWEGILRKRFR